MHATFCSSPMHKSPTLTQALVQAHYSSIQQTKFLEEVIKVAFVVFPAQIKSLVVPVVQLLFLPWTLQEMYISVAVVEFLETTLLKFWQFINKYKYDMMLKCVSYTLHSFRPFLSWQIKQRILALSRSRNA